MAKLFAPNITGRGRVFRGVCGLAMIAGGVVAFRYVRWLGVILVVAAGFVLFEAVRGWCVMRACGIKTKY
jgi:hypothetical protein